MRAWSGPCAASSPRMLLARFSSDPSTETNTRACRRSGDVSTPVIVTNPIRGSFSSGSAAPSTSLTASFTRRMRSVIGCHHLAFHRQQVVFLPVQVPNRIVEQLLELAAATCDAGDGESRALPEVVVVDLRDGRAEAVLEVRLRRLDVLALALERAGFGEVQLDREDADVAGAHGALPSRASRESARADPRRAQTPEGGRFASAVVAISPRTSMWRRPARVSRGRFARPGASRTPRARRPP